MDNELPVTREPESLIGRVLAVPGLIFVIGSVAAFGTAFLPDHARAPYVHIIIGTLSFVFGYVLLRKPRTPESHSILLQHSLRNSTDPIRDFQAITETSGVPGFFRSLGITGLPLATVTITVLFCLLAIMSYGINALGDKEIVPAEFPKLVLELSKLTLGAFIGSFVSRSQSAGTPTRQQPNRSSRPAQSRPAAEL
jgi:hypothetical protein